MKKTLAPYLAAFVLFCGCAPGPTDDSAEQTQPGELTTITCKPGFEFEPLPEIDVADEEGVSLGAFRAWLLLDDGEQKFRILFGPPPLSRGPVALYSYQAYKFTIRTQVQDGAPVQQLADYFKKACYMTLANPSEARKQA